MCRIAYVATHQEVNTQAYQNKLTGKLKYAGVLSSAVGPRMHGGVALRVGMLPHLLLLYLSLISLLNLQLVPFLVAAQLLDGEGQAGASTQS